MSSITTSWGSWTSTSINASTITNTSTATTSTITNNGFSGTEIAVSITYTGTITNGVNVYVLRDVNGTYENENDSPFAFQMPFTSGGGTNERSFTVMADRVSDFKILIDNETGNSCTATVSYKQSTINVA